MNVSVCIVNIHTSPPPHIHASVPCSAYNDRSGLWMRETIEATKRNFKHPHAYKRQAGYTRAWMNEWTKRNGIGKWCALVSPLAAWKATAVCLFVPRSRVQHIRWYACEWFAWCECCLVTGTDVRSYFISNKIHSVTHLLPVASPFSKWNWIL